MKISLHFDSEEFTCHDKNLTLYPKGWINTRLVPLCALLEIIRHHFNQPIKILSGYRTFNYNKLIHGAKSSQHVEGRAADISVKNISPSMVQRYVLELRYKGDFRGGIGLYNTFTHLDIRGTNLTWRGR